MTSNQALTIGLISFVDGDEGTFSGLSGRLKLDLFYFFLVRSPPAPVRHAFFPRFFDLPHCLPHIGDWCPTCPLDLLLAQGVSGVDDVSAKDRSLFGCFDPPLLPDDIQALDVSRSCVGCHSPPTSKDPRSCESDAFLRRR